MYVVTQSRGNDQMRVHWEFGRQRIPEFFSERSVCSSPTIRGIQAHDRATKLLALCSLYDGKTNVGTPLLYSRKDIVPEDLSFEYAYTPSIRDRYREDIRHIPKKAENLPLLVFRSFMKLFKYLDIISHTYRPPIGCP